MSTILVSFLGRVRKSRDAAERYASTNYRFSDGVEEQTAFFGSALRNRLRPDRWLVLGTAGSTWQALLEFAGCSERFPDLWLTLDQKSDQESVTGEDLKLLEQALNGSGWGPISLAVIPYGTNMKDHVDLMLTISRWIHREDEVYMDVTHGFRHLPMIAILSSLHLKIVKGAKIRELYYGAFEMIREDKVPVIELSGLLRIASWMEAMTRFYENGNYGVFSDLLLKEGVQAWEIANLGDVKALELAGLYEPAKEALEKIHFRIQRGLPGAAALVADRLDQEIAWIHGSSPYEYQKNLALRALRRNNLVEASIFTEEAFITSLVPTQQASNHRAREAAEEDFLKSGDPRVPSVWKLKRFRNALAHANSEHLRREEAEVIARSDRLREVLRSLQSQLLP